MPRITSSARPHQHELFIEIKADPKAQIVALLVLNVSNLF